jgi:SSS family solute:Na+ symporter
MDIYKQFMNRNASEKRLVTVGRLTSVAALILALIAVYPIMGGADQAFQIIQEYSGFVYPGVVVIFGLGLLWKRASGTAAVVAAIGTFVFSIAFKFIFPDVPFLLRMGYVFMILVALFMGISFASKKTQPADKLDEHTVTTQLKWGRILFVGAVISFVLGILQKVIYYSTGGWAYLQNVGFEAIFFLGAMLLVLSIYLRSNAIDKVQDPKAVSIDLALFRSDRAFTLGAIGVIVILAILYVALW